MLLFVPNNFELIELNLNNEGNEINDEIKIEYKFENVNKDKVHIIV